jgi:hypothetical protein
LDQNEQQNKKCQRKVVKKHKTHNQLKIITLMETTKEGNSKSQHPKT